VVSAAPPAPVAAAPAAFVPVLRAGDTVPDIALVDERDRPFSFGASGGRVTLVSFIDTRCADPRLCLLVAAKFSYLQHRLRGAPIRLVTLTLDPAHDTPSVLERYGRRYGADPVRWSLVTGRPERIDDLLARFGIVTGARRFGILPHTEAAVLLDARGRIAQIVDGAAWNPDDLLALAAAAAQRRTSVLSGLRVWLFARVGAICGGRGAAPFTAAGALVLFGILAAALGLSFRRLFGFSTHSE
jgi:protein SCO1/2